MGGGEHGYGRHGEGGLYPPGELYTPYEQRPAPPPPPAQEAYPPHHPPPPPFVERDFELPVSGPGHYPPPPPPGPGHYPPPPPPGPAHYPPPPPPGPDHYPPPPPPEHHHHHHHEDPYHRHHHLHDELDRDGVEAERVPPRPRGQMLKLHCQANTDFNLAVRHDGVVLAPANPVDESQQWIKDMSWSTTVRDEKGFPAFMLINKASNKALKHAPGELQQVLLADYQPGVLDETLLWTQSEDMGKGFTTIRMANNIKLNLDAFKGDKKSGGVKDGTPAVLFKWKKQDNQLWKMVPLS